ncbi:excinuclease ABC subunit C [Entomoplasma ellychniae]|uniref:UvrABC system protein C n=1 Tax=Entomoplasma ellychniae TaxID=2114 RepID=A0A8E2UCZ4_9MOLU|nr:excinuclease ABC subunit UvrC [Entomoplasma ellychniae]PPE04877.1 excinuclease ABC subunit C [Entomoplasma ellychniae]
MNIKSIISTLPNQPGCYLYYNEHNNVIYVGKAKNLKKRVSSYFDRVHNLKTTKLVREIVDIKYFVVSNEKESLVLEENLIKKYRPKYNVLLNDDKSYPYITITNEKDPMYKYIRKVDKKALRSFGPLPIGSKAKDSLITLQRLFPLRRCKGNLGKPCFHYFLNQCSGACYKEVDELFYKEQIKKVDMFFKGNIGEVKNNLTAFMNKASENLQFEEAQRIKEQIATLSFMTTKQNVEFQNDLNIDAISFLIDDEKIAISTLFYRSGQLILKDEHIQTYLEQDVNDLMQHFLNQIYKKNIIPDKLILSNEIQLINLSDDFKKIATHPITKDELKMFDISFENAKDIIRRSQISKTINIGNEQEILLQLANVSNTEKELRRIEMFDISNIANEFITGSCVVYINGHPVRNEFRKYNIDAKFTSDYDRLKHMLYRRFQKALLEKRDLPDLIIMDGGIIQIHAAKDILKTLGLEFISVIGLVKNEKHRTEKLIDVNEQEKEIKVNLKLFNWLSAMQIRVDEYAKSGYRKKQAVSLLKNDLMNIEGLGEKRIQILFKKYNTINEIKQTKDEELINLLKNKKAFINLKKYLDDYK